MCRRATDARATDATGMSDRRFYILLAVHFACATMAGWMIASWVMGN